MNKKVQWIVGGMFLALLVIVFVQRAQYAKIVELRSALAQNGKSAAKSDDPSKSVEPTLQGRARTQFVATAAQTACVVGRGVSVFGNKKADAANGRVWSGISQDKDDGLVYIRPAEFVGAVAAVLEVFCQSIQLVAPAPPTQAQQDEFQHPLWRMW